MTTSQQIRLRHVQANGIRMQIAEVGAGPLVVLCHGFPECWYSWRQQMLFLAEAGYHAVAPDMRGYGGTDAPAEIDQYTIFHLVGDVMGLLDALKAPRAVIIGHDWGAPVAWHCALLRPDRVRAVAGLSVPYFPRTPTRPSTAMPRNEAEEFYQLYFCQEGQAEAEFDHDIRQSLRDLSYLWSGDNPDNTARHLSMVQIGSGMLRGRTAPAAMPAWVSDADLDVYVSAMQQHGFRGPLNWYRNIDRNWELTAAWSGAQIRVPALYMVGERDVLMHFKGMDRLVPALEKVIPNLRTKHIVPGCGHWIQRERPREVNDAILALLQSLDD
jgi:pimeloyl-ACP methyl ester carboxylesterase